MGAKSKWGVSGALGFPVVPHVSVVLVRRIEGRLGGVVVRASDL